MNTAKAKKEKKGEGASLGASSGGRVAGQALPRAAQITVRGVVHRSLVGTIAHFFSTGAGMMTLTALVAGASFFSLRDLNRQKEEALAKRHMTAAFNQSTHAQVVGQAAAPSRTDSLSYLAAANQASYGGAPANGQNAADAPAQSALQPAVQTTSIPDQQNNVNVDAAAQAQSMAQGLGSRFGQLSSGIGGGNHLAGGTGLSDGVGRPFDHKTMLAQVPAGAGHGSSSGPVNGAAATTAGVSRTALQGSGGGRGAMGQARAAAAMGHSARISGSSEGQSFQASQAFDGNNGGVAGGGEQIGGTGDGSSGGPGSPAAGVAPGGPTAQAAGSSPSTSGSSNNVPGTDVTPWGGLASMAQMLLMIAGLLLMLASSLTGNLIATPIKHALAWAAAALGAIVTIIGVTLMTVYGQMVQGAIFTASGAVIAVLAVIAATSKANTSEIDDAPKSGDQLVTQEDYDKLNFGGGEGTPSSPSAAGPYSEWQPGEELYPGPANPPGFEDPTSQWLDTSGGPSGGTPPPTGTGGK